jgi:hypothetical protein
MPDAPVQILPNQTAGSTPAAPVQVTANGSGSTPAAPVQVTANGSGSTPTAPVQVTANGSGSTPTAPVQVTANQTGSSTPSAPADVLPAAAAGGGSMTYATGTLTVLGNSGDGIVSILGYGFGETVTTPSPGLSLAETYAANLAAAINSLFDGWGFRPIASVAGAVVTLEANLPGIAGNQIDLASVDPGTVLASGPYLTGGGGDPIIRVTGALTKNGTTPVVFPDLAVDQSRASSEVEYSSTGWDYDTGGPAFDGWYYTAQIQGVLTGTFPSLVLVGYKWTLRATRYNEGLQAECAQWTSATQPTSHPIEAATGWTPDSPATGTPAVNVPILQGFASPPVVTGAASGSTPASPVQIMSNGSASTPTAPPVVVA